MIREQILQCFTNGVDLTSTSAQTGNAINLGKPFGNYIAANSIAESGYPVRGIGMRIHGVAKVTKRTGNNPTYPGVVTLSVYSYNTLLTAEENSGSAETGTEAKYLVATYVVNEKDASKLDAYAFDEELPSNLKCNVIVKAKLESGATFNTGSKLFVEMTAV